MYSFRHRAKYSYVSHNRIKYFIPEQLKTFYYRTAKNMFDPRTVQNTLSQNSSKQFPEQPNIFFIPEQRKTICHRAAQNIFFLSQNSSKYFIPEQLKIFLIPEQFKIYYHRTGQNMLFHYSFKYFVPEQHNIFCPRTVQNISSRNSTTYFVPEQHNIFWPRTAQHILSQNSTAYFVQEQRKLSGKSWWKCTSICHDTCILYIHLMTGLVFLLVILTLCYWIWKASKVLKKLCIWVFNFVVRRKKL